MIGFFVLYAFAKAYNKLIMKKILSEYLEVITIPKWERKKRNEKLQQWDATDYKEFPTYNELKEFEAYCTSKELQYELLFFEKRVMYPVYYQEVFTHKNFDALMDVYQNKSCFYFKDEDGLNTISLLQIGLEWQPGNQILLTDKYHGRIAFFENCIHEIPWILLYDSVVSASIEEADCLIQDIENFKVFCMQYSFEIPQKKIERYLFYATTWKEFLSNHDPNKIGYEEFLVKFHLTEWIAIMQHVANTSKYNSYKHYLEKYN